MSTNSKDARYAYCVERGYHGGITQQIKSVSTSLSEFEYWYETDALYYSSPEPGIFSADYFSGTRHLFCLWLYIYSCINKGKKHGTELQGRFIFGPEYLFAEPQRGDVVVIRFAGRHIMLLKRVVAVEGDTVGFYEGSLYVNGRPIIEPYVKFRGKWNLATRKVEKGNIYVVGDNRDMPISKHKFGQTSKRRIIGGVVF
ncbi:MAG: signal peptidase I [Planctomycetota bacterium]|jgi:signal peptidase I